MRSWIFRHRLRLRAVYGPRLEALPSMAPERSRAARRRADGLGPGECRQLGRWYVMRPMLPEVA